ncbi:hypothetical protein K2Y11_21285 [bacterium]|nr:hypothetical protein [bacterium]
MRTLKQIEAAEKRIAKKRDQMNRQWKKFLIDRDKVQEESVRLKIEKERLTSVK